MPRTQTRLIEKPTPSLGADRQEVEAFAKGLKEAFLHCREMGHAWRPWAAEWDAEHNSYRRGLRCPRCKTKRWQYMGLTGAVLGTQYEYPEGYTAEGIGRIMGEGRDALRLESLTRALSPADMRAMRKAAKNG